MDQSITKALINSETAFAQKIELSDSPLNKAQDIVQQPNI